MYPVGFGYLDVPVWSPGPGVIEKAPPPYRYAGQLSIISLNALEGVDHSYEIVPVNVLLEDGVPSQKLVVRCPGRPNLRLFWSPVPGAVQYKIIRDRFLIATVGAYEARDPEYQNWMSHYDRDQENGAAYTPRGIPCQLVLPFQTTTRESWSPPSQG